MEAFVWMLQQTQTGDYISQQPPEVTVVHVQIQRVLLFNRKVTMRFSTTARSDWTRTACFVVLSLAHTPIHEGEEPVWVWLCTKMSIKLYPKD